MIWGTRSSVSLSISAEIDTEKHEFDFNRDNIKQLVEQPVNYFQHHFQ